MSETLIQSEFLPTDTHAPQSPFDKSGKFYSPCRCGYGGKGTTTPSHAYQATKVHAHTENRREAGGSPLGGGGGSTAPRRSGGAPATPRARSGGGARACGCGCGGTTGGLFCPGHDSTMLSRLQTAVKSGTMSVDDAMGELNAIGASDKLKAKFASRVAA